ncbi:HAD-IA family hydrolase [Candidatus Bathyarchaeota archaeon]|nr:HAD-IA family hydrolase [Candidatus Bathyarchaeota archaeon]
MESSKHRVKAVLFDLGGTLVKTTEIPLVMERILKHRGINRSVREIIRARNEAEKGLDFRDLATVLDEFWVQWNVRILNNLQVDTDTRKLAEYIATHWWDYSEVTLYPDAEKTLPLLKAKGLKIGVVTNGLQSDLKEILSKVGLQDFFDVVVVIDTLRKMKPDVEVFHYALQKLNTAPSEAVFIGDEIEADYKGAKKSGLTAYLIDRNGDVRNQNVNTISSLDDLFKLNILK